MPRTSSPSRQAQHVADAPGQLLLFAPLAGKVIGVNIELHYATGTEPAVVCRIERAAARLRRGAQASAPKMKKAARLLEELAGLFDGV